MQRADNITNREMFMKETNLYEVEPIVRSTFSWMNMEDVPDEKKARFLDFQQLTGKKLYARFVRVAERSYWKLYIVDRVDRQFVQILYVDTVALEQGELYKP